MENFNAIISCLLSDSIETPDSCSKALQKSVEGESLIRRRSARLLSAEGNAAYRYPKVAKSLPGCVNTLAQESTDEVWKIWQGRQIKLVIAPELWAGRRSMAATDRVRQFLRQRVEIHEHLEQATIEAGAMAHDGTTAYFVRDHGLGSTWGTVENCSALFNGCMRWRTIASIGLAMVSASTIGTEVVSGRKAK